MIIAAEVSLEKANLYWHISLTVNIMARIIEHKYNTLFQLTGENKKKWVCLTLVKFMNIFNMV